MLTPLPVSAPGEDAEADLAPASSSPKGDVPPEPHISWHTESDPSSASNDCTTGPLLPIEPNCVTPTNKAPWAARSPSLSCNGY
jgi:hypothetical protein